MSKPLAFDDAQLANLLAAAQLVPTGSRDLFLRSVGSRLADIDQPNNHQLSEAITFILQSRGIHGFSDASD